MNRGTPRRKALAAYYRAQRLRPIDGNLAAFAAYWYRGVSCNPKAIYDEARRAVPGLRGVWVVNRDRVRTVPNDVPYVVAGTMPYYDLIARAKVLVNNVNWPNHLVKRPGTVHVMTHHGTPLKHMGLQLRGKPIEEGESDFEALLRRCARWDYSVSSNSHTTLAWQLAYPATYTSLDVGYPRNDVLVRCDGAATLAARESLGLTPEQKVLLYTPTHRDYDDSYVARLDLRALAEGLGPEWVVLSRRHYYYEEAAGPPMPTSVRDVADHPSIEKLCMASDVLCTDYSSIMFDYANLGRPIVIHAPDWEEYVRSRGVYFDLMQHPPGVVTRTDDELIRVLRDGSATGEQAVATLRRFAARFCDFESGHAASSVVAAAWPDARVSVA
jgi:CDP-glycerol glycerophosphotransferase